MKARQPNKADRTGWSKRYLLRCKARAFTLLELLVVIAIIAILIAILIPGLRLARAQAGTVACQARLREWGLGFKMYTDDNEGRWFSGVWLSAMRPFWQGTAKGRNPLAPGLNIRDRGLTLCPLTKLDKPEPFDAAIVHYDYPHPLRPNTVAVSYAFNVWLQPKGSAEGYCWGNCQTKNPWAVPVLGDGTAPIVKPLHNEPPPGVGPNGTEWAHVCINRHNGGINMLFMDWSVRKVGLKELWTLKWHRQFDTAGPWTLAGGVRPQDWPAWMQKFKDY